ncbi:MAG: barA 4, partial [Planctomycetaceae bacterium]|nr:barA 4 [Planctomycetaceae bacterium]
MLDRNSAAESERAAKAPRRPWNDWRSKVRVPHVSENSKQDEPTIQSPLGRTVQAVQPPDTGSQLNLNSCSYQDAVIGRSLDGLIVSWNTGAEEIYGYSETEVVGQPASLLIPEHLEQEEPELVCVVRHGIRLNQFETSRRRKDGKIIKVAMTVSPVLDVSGQVIGTSSTERYSKSLRSRSATHPITNGAVQAAAQTKTEFLSNVSHELRTPMNAIIGMLDLTLAAHQLAPQVHQYLETAQESAHLLLSLLDDLLDFSRMEAGKFELDIQPFNLRLILDDALRVLSLQARDRGLELVSEVQADIPDRLEGDARRLRQIVTSLVGNAIKFTEQGRIEL